METQTKTEEHTDNGLFVTDYDELVKNSWDILRSLKWEIVINVYLILIKKKE